MNVFKKLFWFSVATCCLTLLCGCTPEPEPEEVSIPEDWQTFTEQRQIYKLQMPAGWSVAERESSEFYIKYIADFKDASGELFMTMSMVQITYQDNINTTKLLLEDATVTEQDWYEGFKQATIRGTSKVSGEKVVYHTIPKNIKGETIVFSIKKTDEESFKLFEKMFSTFTILDPYYY